MEGTITFFNAAKLYGRIKADDSTVHDIFVHVREVQRESFFGYRAFLLPGDRVEFDLEHDANGKSIAKCVRIIGTVLHPVERAVDVYYEAGTLTPPTKKGVDYTFIIRPDGDRLYVHFRNILHLLDRVLLGENISCEYRVECFVGTNKYGEPSDFYRAKTVTESLVEAGGNGK